MRVLTFILLVGAAANVTPLSAQVDPLAVTPEEKALCQSDAERLCASTYPDENKLLACMRANRTALTPNCLQVFDAGLKRRGL